MPFESQWARIPLSVRWAVSLLLGAAVVVALVLFVTHNNNNGLAHVSAKAEKRETRQAEVIVGSDQAPRTVQLRSASDARAALVAGVRADMRHRISTGNVDGPLQKVACGQSGHRAGKLGFHCIAEAADVNYPFLAVATPSAHSAVYCKKDFPPSPSENIPVSARCRL
jgi:hypothetical protein